MSKTTVSVYGKIRIPTEAHKGLIDHADKIAKDVGGKLDVTLSGAEKPLSAEDKQKHASNILGKPVSVKPKSSFITHLTDLHKSGVEHLHLVAGSDRVGEYRNILDRYNGKADKKGVVPFNFKSHTVHAFGSERNEGELDRHPTKIKNILPHTSATNVEKFANSGDYAGFKAFYRNTPEEHVKSLYDDIRKKKESILLTFKGWLIENIL
jgi:hypothetical protein